MKQYKKINSMVKVGSFIKDSLLGIGLVSDIDVNTQSIIVYFDTRTTRYPMYLFDVSNIGMFKSVGLELLTTINRRS